MTLIELMIVVVIIGIIAAIAYPSYRNYVLRANRATAMGHLEELRQFLEREFTNTGRYDDAEDEGELRVPLPFDQSPRDDPNPTYELTLAALTATTYSLEAEPQEGQAQDACGILSVNQNNVKCINDGAACSDEADEQAAVADCW